MATDFKWMSNGGLLLSDDGDIGVGGGLDTVISMVRTRLKAAVDGWKLYRIGAGLDDFPGSTSDTQAEISIRRRVLQCISNGFLPTSAFQVTTLRLGQEIQVFVYLQEQLIATTSVTFNQNSLVG